MPFSRFPSFALLFAAALTACSATELTQERIRVGGNSPKGLYAGAAAIIITPEIVETFTDLDYAEDVTGWAPHEGKDGRFNGMINDPAGAPDAGREGFDDVNGNGIFDAVWLAGSDSSRPANAVHDDLYVRALAVRSGTVTIIFMTVDAVGYFNDEIRAIREAVARQVEFDQLVMSATHSHETPDTIGIWGPQDGIAGWSPEYRELIRARAVAAAVEAAKKATPVVLAVNSGSIVPESGAYKAGNMHFDARDPVAIDDSVGVMQFQRTGTFEPVATLVTWAGHPEHMIDDNLISADYPFYLRSALEAKWPGSTALFVNGVLGGQIGTNHADVVRGGKHWKNNAGIDCRAEEHAHTLARFKSEGRCPAGSIGDKDWMWKKAEAVGLNLADRAVELLAQAEVAKSPAISVKSKDVYLPIDNKGYRLMFVLKTLQDRLVFKDAQGAELGDVAAYTINERWYVRTDVQRIDFTTADETLLQILTIPGEMHPELAVGGWNGGKTGGLQPLVDPNNANPPYPRLADTACATPPCWDVSQAPQGPFLRDKMTGKHKMLFGLTGDELGYIVPPYNWELDVSNPYLSEPAGDHYEETNSLGPETAPRLMAVYDELLAD